ncbi:MAG: prepilin-type N-terminal cleavage/methylation domain-containing protein [Geodermatophilaceae bacterium]|nr:prepilin-type N-terminal cleavage/methylation domain-containing protein [Geodermatophilaceae bacterium]
MKEKDKGFTLIELLVVIIIIGILAAIAIPIFLNQRKKGVDASLNSDLNSMSLAQETWATDNPTEVGVDVTVPEGGAIEVGTDGETFTASDGNNITVTVMDNVGYCIEGWNAGASDATSAPDAILYDSAAGGLNPEAPVACA